MYKIASVPAKHTWQEFTENSKYINTYFMGHAVNILSILSSGTIMGDGETGDRTTYIIGDETRLVAYVKYKGHGSFMNLIIDLY